MCECQFCLRNIEISFKFTSLRLTATAVKNELSVGSSVKVKTKFHTNTFKVATQKLIYVIFVVFLSQNIHLDELNFEIAHLKT